MWIDERGSEVLGLAECRHLLAVGATNQLVGHLGISKDGAPLVLPIDYTVYGPDVLIRVGDGLLQRIVGRLVAFQVDNDGEHQDNAGPRWSVLVRGLATEEDDAAFSEWMPTPRVVEPGRRIVRVRADRVTGRRIPDDPQTPSSQST